VVQDNPEGEVMRAVLLASVVMTPSLAMAQQVPAIQANAAASAGIAAAHPVTGATGLGGAAVPAGMPPAVVHTLSASAPLNAKEKASAADAAAWRNHTDRPSRGEDGVLRWVFGASLPSVVCSPLQVCDVALQPGEVINSIHVGDKVRWSIMPAITGTGADRTTHIIVKPSDAGLVSSILVYTDRRIYSIKLVSTQAQWTPMTGFTYPETMQAAWTHYGATMGAGNTTVAAAPIPDPGISYSISGSASWKPTSVYSASGKTYLVFPSPLQYGSAPALIGYADDAGWFSSPSEQMLRYRVAGNTYMIDGIPEHFALVAGVGSSQSKVEIRKRVN
jgi:P-type conjugative transfer protein TrbG